MPNATSSPLPAVVTIQDLPSYSAPLSGSELLEAVQTVGGVAMSVQVPLTALLTTVFGGLPTGGGTGQLLNKTNANNYSTQWSNITQFVGVGTGLVTSGSATSIMVAFAQQSALSVLGVTGNATLEPAAIVGAAAQVLRVNDAGNALAFGAVNLGSSAAVTGVLPGVNMTAVNLASSGAGGVQGVLPVPNGGTNTSILTLNGVLFGNGTSTVGITAAGATGSVLVNPLGVAPSFTTSPVIATSVTVPTIFGGTAGASGLIIKGTSSATPSGDTITLQVGGLTAVLQNSNATTAGVVFNQNATAGTTIFGTSISGVRLIAKDSQIAGFLVNGFGAAGTNLFTRADGTAGGPAAVTSGDVLGSIQANGYDGVSYSPAQLAVRMIANENWNSTSHGTRFDIILTPNGTTAISVPSFAVYPAVLTSGGATAILITPTAGLGIYVGTGSPSISAATGSLYIRNDATTNTSRLYVNNSGTGTWTAVNTVA